MTRKQHVALLFRLDNVVAEMEKAIENIPAPEGCPCEKCGRISYTESERIPLSSRLDGKQTGNAPEDRNYREISRFHGRGELKMEPHTVVEIYEANAGEIVRMFREISDRNLRMAMADVIPAVIIHNQEQTAQAFIRSMRAHLQVQREEKTT